MPHASSWRESLPAQPQGDVGEWKINLSPISVSAPWLGVSYDPAQAGVTDSLVGRDAVTLKGMPAMMCS